MIIATKCNQANQDTPAERASFVNPVNLKSSEAPLSRRLLVAYYASTALFVILDFIVGLNLRLAFLDQYSGARLTYYLVCFGCFLAMWRLPQWTGVIAAVESTIALAALIIDFWTRIFAMPAIVIDGGQPISFEEIINFMLSGSAAYIALAFRSHRARVELNASRSGD